MQEIKMKDIKTLKNLSNDEKAILFSACAFSDVLGTRYVTYDTLLLTMLTVPMPKDERLVRTICYGKTDLSNSIFSTYFKQYKEMFIKNDKKFLDKSRLKVKTKNGYLFSRLAMMSILYMVKMGFSILSLLSIGNSVTGHQLYKVSYIYNGFLSNGLDLYQISQEFEIQSKSLEIIERPTTIDKEMFDNEEKTNAQKVSIGITKKDNKILNIANQLKDHNFQLFIQRIKMRSYKFAGEKELIDEISNSAILKRICMELSSKIRVPSVIVNMTSYSEEQIFMASLFKWYQKYNPSKNIYYLDFTKVQDNNARILAQPNIRCNFVDLKDENPLQTKLIIIRCSGAFCEREINIYQNIFNNVLSYSANNISVLWLFPLGYFNEIKETIISPINLITSYNFRINDFYDTEALKRYKYNFARYKIEKKYLKSPENSNKTISIENDVWERTYDLTQLEIKRLSSRDSSEGHLSTSHFVNEQIDKIIYLVESTILRKQNAAPNKPILVSYQDVYLTFMELFLDKKTFECDFSHLQERLNQNVFGQDEAIQILSDSILIAESGINPPNKPLASYLFVGPTGVGKTELAKTLAKETQMSFARFDMSEYQSEIQISTLIGAAAGYVGFDMTSEFEQKISGNGPYVVLFDEIEKANPRIYNLFLQILDYGKITLANHKTIDFTNSVIIFTSNAGSRDAEEMHPLGFTKNAVGLQDVKDHALKEIFTPEFRGRLDKIIYFKPLTDTIIMQVIRKKISQIHSYKFPTIQIHFEESVYQYLFDCYRQKGTSARDIDHIIREKIYPGLSKMILNYPNCSLISCKYSDAKIQYFKA